MAMAGVMANAPKFSSGSWLVGQCLQQIVGRAQDAPRTSGQLAPQPPFLPCAAHLQRGLRSVSDCCVLNALMAWTFPPAGKGTNVYSIHGSRQSDSQGLLGPCCLAGFYVENSSILPPCWMGVRGSLHVEVRSTWRFMKTRPAPLTGALLQVPFKPPKPFFVAQ